MSETFTGVVGRPVIAADTAENIGEVKGLVIDQTATYVESVHLSGRGRRAEVLPWSSIRSFGSDAVVAELSTSAEQVSSEHETESVKGNVDMVGVRVLDTNGFEHGTVDDVMFDPSSGRLTGALTGQGRLDADSFCSVGSYALVIDATESHA